MTPLEQIQSNILELQSALQEAHPRLPRLLQEIHAQLKNEPDVVTVLSEEEIAVIIAGLSRQTNTSLIAKSSSASKTKRLAATSLDDL